MKHLIVCARLSFFIAMAMGANLAEAQSSLDILLQKDRSFQEKEFNQPQQYFPDVSREAQLNRLSFYKGLLEELRAIDRSALALEEKINYDLLKYVLEDRVAQIEYEAYLVPLNAEGGWYSDFLLNIQYLSFSSQADYENYLARLSAFPAYAQQQMALMRQGLEKGITAPQVILKGREKTIDKALIPGDDNPFFQPFLVMPDGIPAEVQQKLRDQARKTIADAILPTYTAFHTFWSEAYFPGSQIKIGISAQPRGEAYYEQRVQHFTTLPINADTIFEIGLKEVARIKAEMEAIILELGFEGSFSEFLSFLRTDPQFYAPTPEALLKEASYIAKKIDGKLPAYFGHLPRNPYGVSPVPEAIAPTYTTGRYSEGSPKDHRAGFYWVNTYNLPARPLYALPALTLHEAVPGHHLQISLAQELPEMSDFRRETYLSAFGEGWALYCEWLGEEMGVYANAYERFGRLTYEMWRACRLVVDPGIHVRGWTRQQAIDFLVNNTALSVHECTTEIDRYIGWPGQAVSYKIGELTIRSLRQKAEQALGEQFRLRDFHDLVLSQGSIPLFTLEEMVEAWIEKQKQ
ncbi:MAG TPA: DUF885 domain-containing protein [Saprospiraceae bacterium]|nr:DUF885 domain-containing protein [Saprospiraceae bacterium]HMQ85167.1 DUF885 domain-containing protein [Saprospiraceae bacterium]